MVPRKLTDSSLNEFDDSVSNRSSCNETTFDRLKSCGIITLVILAVLNFWRLLCTKDYSFIMISARIICARENTNSETIWAFDFSLISSASEL